MYVCVWLTFQNGHERVIDCETARIPNRPPEFKVDGNGMMELPGNDWCIIQVCYSFIQLPGILFIHSTPFCVIHSLNALMYYSFTQLPGVSFSCAIRLFNSLVYCSFIPFPSVFLVYY